MQREQSCHLKCRIRGSKSKTNYCLSSSEIQWQGYRRKQNSLANEGTATTLRTNGRTANPAETRNSCTQKSWGAGFANYLQINYPTLHPLTARYCQADQGRCQQGRGCQGGHRAVPQPFPRTGWQGSQRDGMGRSRTGRDRTPHQAAQSTGVFTPNISRAKPQPPRLSNLPRQEPTALAEPG